MPTKNTTHKDTGITERLRCPYIMWGGRDWREPFCCLSERPCTELPDNCKQFHDKPPRKRGQP